MQVYHAVILWMFPNLTFLTSCWACRSAEYEINRECCPMCPAGERVYSHCSEDSSTTCVNCTRHTYTDVPNGLIKCLPCTVCDEGSGLRIKRECNKKANALCEPLAGYYCTDLQENNCRKARKHSTCLPGQFIYQNGTEIADNVCQDCPEFTYSNSSLTFCRPHTHCELMGMITVSVGTKTADSECSLRSRLYSIISISGLLILSVALIINCTVRRRRTEDEQGYKSPSQCEQGNRSLPQCEQRVNDPVQSGQSSGIDVSTGGNINITSTNVQINICHSPCSVTQSAECLKPQF
uniref:TNFR-Cys domain-containing protein n=1 Tax=Astyanax mexicanus TaxID=7994 RepID=A0A3B1IFN5_ASTMX